MFANPPPQSSRSEGGQVPKSLFFAMNCMTCPDLHIKVMFVTLTQGVGHHFYMLLGIE